MSPCQFSVYMEKQGRVVDVEIPSMREGRVWRVTVLLFADDAIFYEWDFLRLVSEFGNVWKKHSLNVNAAKYGIGVLKKLKH